MPYDEEALTFSIEPATNFLWIPCPTSAPFYLEDSIVIDISWPSSHSPLIPFIGTPGTQEYALVCVVTSVLSVSDSPWFNT